MTSSHALEPGTRLVDRYRLDQRLVQAAGTSWWRATDEVLDRPVSVCLLAADHDSAARVLDAARRAAALSDPRFLRVLDASEAQGVVYVVSEWVPAATPLLDLLADGPLHPVEARDIALDIAAALDSAHRDGLAHLCLQPEHVLRTPHGQTKLSGLAVDAAVRGISADPTEAARLDTTGAAAIAYAALTARWPGEAPSALADAPRDGAATCTPRQVRAGVPHDLDNAVSRGLGLAHHGEPLLTPADLADALARAHVPGRDSGPNAADDADTGERFGFADDRAGAVPGRDRGHRSRATTAAWAAVVLVLTVGLALAAGQLVLSLVDDGSPATAGPQASPDASPTSSPGPTGERVAIVAARSFDPLPDGTGEENDYAVPRAVDRDTSTVWLTKAYNDPFGPAGLKDGVGLLLDLGSSRRIGSVTVRTAGGPTDLVVLTSDREGAAVSDFTALTDREVRGVDGRATVVTRDDRSARWVLVWLTSLPRDGNRYRGGISEVSVHD